MKPILLAGSREIWHAAAMDFQRDLERTRQKVRLRHMVTDFLRDLPVAEQREILLEILVGLETAPISPVVQAQLQGVRAFRVDSGQARRELVTRSALVSRIMTVLEHRPRGLRELREQIPPSVADAELQQTLSELERTMRIHERENVWYAGAADSDENVPGADEPTIGQTILAILMEQAPEGMAASDVMAELKRRRSTEAAVGYSAAARLIKRRHLRREAHSNGTVTYFLENPHSGPRDR